MVFYNHTTVIVTDLSSTSMLNGKSRELLPKQTKMNSQ